MQQRLDYSKAAPGSVQAMYKLEKFVEGSGLERQLLELVKGRERLFLEHFWQTLSLHPETFTEADRQLYAKAYAQEGAMHAACEMFKLFNTQDAADNRRFAALHRYSGGMNNYVRIMQHFLNKCAKPLSGMAVDVQGFGSSTRRHFQGEVLDELIELAISQLTVCN